MQLFLETSVNKNSLIKPHSYDIPQECIVVM